VLDKHLTHVGYRHITLFVVDQAGRIAALTSDSWQPLWGPRKRKYKLVKTASVVWNSRF